MLYKKGTIYTCNKNRVLGINLRKDIQDLNRKNKTWLKVTRGLNKWKDVPCLWITILNIVKIYIFSQFDL